MTDRMELLAPAGNAQVALAAFDAGADAVYCGLHKFNARERSENFTREELAKVIAHAHKNGRRVYVTFNTLLKESELPEVAAEMAHLALYRPDALIVQDLGAARMLREYFPDLPLHASTQLGIHNSAGLQAAREFGFRRVILERQVTLDELRIMIPAGRPPVELELFVHGALCCCLSGSCLFSSWLGGWSGNRGKCKQPCRRQYFRSDGSSGSTRGEFLFSPDDLCALELLDEFRKLGVCSLKIEGRLRRADYVEKVVRAYRTVLDAPEEKRGAALSAAQDLLRGVRTRNPSLGFYSTASMKKLVRLDPVGGSGLPCGTVEGPVPGGFEAVMSGRLHVGDTIRVQSSGDAGDGFNMTVLYLEVGRRSVMKALSGERCFIRSDRKAGRDSLIYRTGEAGADLSARVAGLPLPKTPLDLTVRLSRSGLTVRVSGVAEEFHAETPSLAPARNQALSADELAREFAAAASTVFEAGAIAAEVDGVWFLPASERKEIRRRFWRWAEDRVPRDSRKQRIGSCLRRFRQDYAELRLHADLERSAPFPDCTAAENGPADSGVSARNLDSAAGIPGEEVILPPFVPEGGLAAMRMNIARLRQKGVKTFRLTSFFQFALFPPETRENLTLKTMFPFPVCNSQTVLVCRELGAQGVQAWLELGQGDLPALLERSVLPVEVYAYGAPCLFTTRAALLPWHRIRDVRDRVFLLERDHALTHLYPSRILRLDDLPEGVSRFRDLRHAADGTEFTVFNSFREWA